MLTTSLLPSNSKAAFPNLAVDSLNTGQLVQVPLGIPLVVPLVALFKNKVSDSPLPVSLLKCNNKTVEPLGVISSALAKSNGM